MVGDPSVVELWLEAVGVGHEQGRVGEKKKKKKDTIDIQERPSKMEKEW